MSLGPAEMAIIFVVVLLLFGAKKLPELARGMGKAMGEFKSAREEFEREIHRAEFEVKSEPKKQLASTSRPAAPAQAPAAEAPAASASPEAADTASASSESTSDSEPVKQTEQA